MLPLHDLVRWLFVLFCGGLCWMAFVFRVEKVSKGAEQLMANQSVPGSAVLGAGFPVPRFWIQAVPEPNQEPSTQNIEPRTVEPADRQD